jgi:hypothetical protein
MSRKILELAREQQDEMDQLLDQDAAIPAEADEEEGSVQLSLQQEGRGETSELELKTWSSPCFLLSLLPPAGTERQSSAQVEETTMMKMRTTMRITVLERRRRSTRSWSVHPPPQSSSRLRSRPAFSLCF